MHAPVELRACLPTEPPASDLLAEMVAEMIELYAITDGVVGVPLKPEDMAPPGGVYLVGWAGDAPVAGGGLRLITPEIAEIKRMYIRPPFRGRGWARVLLGALEAEAARLGARIVRLDTGSKQSLAKGLYQRSGYTEIGNWNDNAQAAYWGEKRIG